MSLLFYHYPDSAISDIHSCTVPELERHRVKRALEALSDEGVISYTGEKRWRRYYAVDE